jgi:hypothetical protein
MADEWRIEKRNHLNVDSLTPSLKALFGLFTTLSSITIWSVAADFL